jgi:pimeloyl-ACP methyl ester carboxylesterase
MDETIEVNGVRLYFRREGAGDLILFLHGFPEHGEVWAALLETFQSGHLAAAPDGRGHGRSDCPDGAEYYRIEILVKDVLAIADHLGAARFALVGHDWGGIVAWFTAARHPERVSHLVTIASPHPSLLQARLDDDPAQRSASSYIARLTEPGLAATLTPEGLWAAIFARDEQAGLIGPEERDRLLASWRRPGAIAAILNWYRAAPFDFAPVGGIGAGRIGQMLRIDVPTLVIWGRSDPLLLPRLLDGLDALVPDLTVHAIPEASHAIVRERPALVAGLIADHLARRSR